MPNQKIKTLLIDDSGFMRILLSDALRKENDIELVGTATNGLEGVEKVKSLKPDVVITDMMMPQFDGLYVVRQLMEEMPLPIILLSSLDRTDPKIFDALKEGAFDFLDKPQKEQISNGYQKLANLVREAYMSDYLRQRKQTAGRNTYEHTFEARLNYDIIAIGASTGGPGAVEFIVNNLPGNLMVPVVIAQHMPERFIESFAPRLNDVSSMKVQVARNGVHLLSNHIYLAPGTANMRIDYSGSTPVVKYVQDQYKEFNSPSVDCVLESVASVYGKRSIGVVLTGMGKDGTIGLNKIREAGGLTISQDEESSVVYGMPKSAYESGASKHQIKLKEIPNFIISAL